MRRWCEEEYAALAAHAKEGLSAAETAKLMGRTERSVTSKAAKLEISFDSARFGELRNFLKRGGHLMREDIGGAIGVRWAPAHRNRKPFDVAMCERFAELGLITQDRQRPAIWRAPPEVFE